MTPVTKPALRYHGAKFRLAPWVISHFPQHRCYVEPFGGAAGVLLRKEPSYSEVYNDLDEDIVNYFRVLRDPAQSARLIEICQLTPYSRTEFKLAYADQPECPIEKARLTVVRATMGFGSAGATFGDTGFRSDTKREYGNPIHVWNKYPAAIAELNARLSNVLIENKPAISVMANHDAPTTLHYIDPPYVPQTRERFSRMRYYRHEMTIDDHETLLEFIKTLKGYVVISGYESDLYSSILTGWSVKSKSSRASGNTGSKMRTECLWINPAAAEALAKQKKEKSCAA